MLGGIESFCLQESHRDTWSRFWKMSKNLPGRKEGTRKGVLGKGDSMCKSMASKRALHHLVATASNCRGPVDFSQGSQMHDWGLLGNYSIATTKDDLYVKSLCLSNKDNQKLEAVCPEDFRSHFTLYLPFLSWSQYVTFTIPLHHSDNFTE